MFGDGFCSVAESWIVNYWNKAAEKILFVPRDQILGQYLWNIFSDSIGSTVYNKYHDSFKTNNRVIFEYYY
ncbi:MAG: PAS domain-containing protein, partial [Ginsengibacter sp.]